MRRLTASCPLEPWNHTSKRAEASIIYPSVSKTELSCARTVEERRVLEAGVRAARRVPHVVRALRRREGRPGERAHRGVPVAQRRFCEPTGLAAETSSKRLAHPAPTNECHSKPPLATIPFCIASMFFQYAVVSSFTSDGLSPIRFTASGPTCRHDGLLRFCRREITLVHFPAIFF